MAQVGKTHLAVNLAVELVRRGHQVGLYHELESLSPIDELLVLRPPEVMHRRAGDSIAGGAVACRGYQGVDILACETPLHQWPDVPRLCLTQCIDSMDVQEGYDDFLIDTSGMAPQTLLACCRASARVMLVVTTEPRSQAEAFALLRVLQLNGFDGELRLLINRVTSMAAAAETGRAFSRQVQQHLGYDLPSPDILLDDNRVSMAQRSRQAFSSLFPESRATGCVVAVAATLVDQPAAAAETQTLAGFWRRFLEVVRAPVCLAGNTLLETQQTGKPSREEVLPEVAEEPACEMKLLQFDGDFTALHELLARIPALLQSLGAGVSDLVEALDAADTAACSPAGHRQENRQLAMLAISLLRTALAAGPVARQVQLEVEECQVSGADPDWLQAGHYLKYVFRIAAGDAVLAALESLLVDVPGMKSGDESAGELLREILTPAHDGSLSVVRTPQDGVRIQIWIPVAAESSASVAGDLSRHAETETAGISKLLH
jgi:flagellar biosynthesis protein FlhG